MAMFLYKLTLSKQTIIAVVGLCLSSCWGCSSKDTSVAKLDAFDVPNYFKNEISRLQRDNSPIIKTVHKDSLTETKELQIADWESELASFISTDINKPAYHGYIKKDSVANLVTYTILNKDLEISSIQLTYAHHQVDAIAIDRKIKNSLYTTTEHLVYRKNKSYSVEKNQAVKLMGNTYYKIEGYFKSNN